jgi:RNA polymerase sigma-70 factor (ECF subfamily)
MRSAVDERQSDIEDGTLVEAARAGDEIAFGHLVERYKDVVFATVVAITHDFDSAQDIAQEVFLRAWFGLGSLRQSAALPGWLNTIARNRAKTWLERQRRQPLQEKVDLAQIADSADSPERNAEKAERRRLVLAALEQLPESSRQALVLHYIEGLATPQLATQLGITEAAVRQRLRRARQHMQEEVENMVADVLRDEAPGADFTQSVEVLLKRSKELFQQVRYRAAVPALESAREQAPTDTLVSLLLADAYTFARTPEDLAADRSAWDRALALIDEVLEREPDNILAQLRRVAVRSMLAPQAEILSEQEKILEAARGGPFEAVAELEMARRHLGFGQAEQALACYGELQEKYAWLACVLHSGTVIK